MWLMTIFYHGEHKTMPKFQVDHHTAGHVFASTSLGEEPEIHTNQTAEETSCSKRNYDARREVKIVSNLHRQEAPNSVGDRKSTQEIQATIATD